MIERTLFDNEATALARPSDPDTSHVAAARVRAAALERRVLRALVHHGPQNCRELVVSASIEYASLTPRIKPLRTKGLVDFAMVDGKPLRRDRQNVYEATERGIRFDETQ